MAEAKKTKKRQLKKTETVRERAEKATVEKKPRRIKQAGSVVFVPFRLAWRGIKAVLRPFRFLLWPFKTRPVRFIGRILRAILLLNYFRASWGELRQVVWPKRRETAKLTVAVFLFAIFFGLIITLADYGLDKVFKKLILK